MTRQIPEALLTRPFTARRAQEFGVTGQVLRGSRFVRLHRDVYAVRHVELTHLERIAAGALALCGDTPASHHTALQVHGIDIGPRWPLHFSTNGGTQSRDPGIVLHRRQGRLSPRRIDGILALGPDRSFVDAATTLGFVQLVQAGDALLGEG